MKKAIKKAKLSKREMRISEAEGRNKNHLEIMIRSEDNSKSELMQSKAIEAAMNLRKLLEKNCSFEVMMSYRNLYD